MWVNWLSHKWGPLQMDKTKASVIGFPPAAESTTVNRRLVARWGGHEGLLARPEGWVGVPDAFLRQYARLKPYGLTVGEAMFVLQLMAYKWSDEAPFPSLREAHGRQRQDGPPLRRQSRR